MKRKQLFNEIRNLLGLPAETGNKVLRFTEYEMRKVVDSLNVPFGSSYRRGFENIPGYTFQGIKSWDSNTHKSNLLVIHNLLRNNVCDDPAEEPAQETKSLGLDVVTEVLLNISEGIGSDFAELDIKVFNRKPKASVHVNLFL